MKVELLKNSTYRVRKMMDGVKYTIYFDHEPTEKEITVELGKAIATQGSNSPIKGSVEEYANKYLSVLKQTDKSPATVRGYASIIRNTPEWFLGLQLGSVTNKQVQKLVDQYKVGRSSKTVINFFGFYRTIFAEYRPDFTVIVKLPEREKKLAYEPSTKDVMAILDYVKGTRYSTFLQLSVLGLRRGEIAALTLDDLSDDNVLTINKDKIMDEHNQYLIKETAKTQASNRRILIPASLADEIRTNGYIYDGNPKVVNDYLHRVQSHLGIPAFRLHTLRHFAAAYLNKQGFTRNQIQEYCGWTKGSSVMERVYSYNLDPEEAQVNIASSFGNLF